jgi:hypothetical protein
MCKSATLQREPLLRVHGNTEHILLRDMCKSATIQREPLLRVYGNAENLQC